MKLRLDFDEDPDVTYVAMEDLVLRRLGLGEVGFRLGVIES